MSDGGFGLHLEPGQGQPTMLFDHIFVTYMALFEIHNEQDQFLQLQFNCNLKKYLTSAI